MNTTVIRGLEQNELELALRHPLLATLDDKARGAVAKAGRLLRYRARRSLCKQGEKPYLVQFILEGSARVFCQAESGDHERLVGFAAAPAVVGANEALSGRDRDAAQTLEPTVVLQIPTPLFRWLLENQPKFAVAFCQLQAEESGQRAELERAYAFDAMPARVARVLLGYAALLGEETAEGIRFTQPISQEVLAKDVGASRKSVNEALKSFKSEKLVAKTGARYVIRDRQALRAQFARAA